MEFFDSHSHYNDEKFNEDREKIIKDTFESGITKFVCAGYNIPSSLFSLELSKNMNIYIRYVAFRLMIFHNLSKNCGKVLTKLHK